MGVSLATRRLCGNTASRAKSSDFPAQIRPATPMAEGHQAPEHWPATIGKRGRPRKCLAANKTWLRAIWRTVSVPLPASSAAPMMGDGGRHVYPAAAGQRAPEPKSTSSDKTRRIRRASPLAKEVAAEQRRSGAKRMLRGSFHQGRPAYRSRSGRRRRRAKSHRRFRR
jgi:hypothetical protein